MLAILKGIQMFLKGRYFSFLNGDNDTQQKIYSLFQYSSQTNFNQILIISA